MSDDKIWPLAPHTLAKHVILRKYLDAWLPKITRWNRRIVFCDGFAGPGVYSGGEDGSPIIALKAYLEHSYRDQVDAEIKYLFIEENTPRYESLCEVIDGMDVPEAVDITILNKTYEEAFTELLDFLDEQGDVLAPTFAFIDPFGVKGLPLDIVRRLMAYKSCEVLITFMVEPLTRWISTPEFESHCNDLFGCPDWRDARELRGVDREPFFRRLYQDRLQAGDGVGAKYVRHFTMKNERNVTIYDLFFATNHPRGIEAMKDAMWHVDSSGGYSFSDATNPDQETFFSDSPNWDQLIDLLVEAHGRSIVPWPQVEETIRHTPYPCKKNEIKAFARGGSARLEVVNPPGVKYKPLNDRSSIRFLE